MIAITAATGQLGRHVTEQLLAQVPAAQVVAVVRNPAKATDLSAQGVTVRAGDYNDKASLVAAFQGVQKVLLISSNEIGQRARQHQNAIDAAKEAGVSLLVYTSLLKADTSPLSLAPEHLATEQALKASGVPYVILRNGWYSENYAGSVPTALAHGAFVGSAGEGRIASAARADYAAAAVVALTQDLTANQTFELAGDEAYTLTELAAEISRQSGKDVPYVNLPEAEYAAVLSQAGLPTDLAQAIAGWDAGAAQGALFDDRQVLSQLIGRPTTPLSATISQALQA
ncbi:MAG: SDR family oxidoreductase [Verrucomicrobiota bacterium JB022]|nr:SDR family oxidoreductase [Verrucomicrobiota bacterium JB022]